MSYIKYETVRMKKREVLQFIITTLEDNGWTSVASNESTEGWIYKSKGTNGKRDILVNLRDGYSGHKTANIFSTGNSHYFEIRMLNSYIPNATSGVVGVSDPVLNNAEYARAYVGVGEEYIYYDTDYIVRYNCNADRMIVCMTTDTPNSDTFFMMFGRPTVHLAKEYTDTGNMFIMSRAYRYHTGVWGIADRAGTARTDLKIRTSPILKGITKDVVIMSEISIDSDTEGYKGVIEGLYVIDTPTGMTVDNSIDNTLIKDELGNEFTLMYVNPVNISSYPAFMPNKIFAVCTKLAGES